MQYKENNIVSYAIPRLFFSFCKFIRYKLLFFFVPAKIIISCFCIDNPIWTFNQFSIKIIKCLYKIISISNQFRSISNKPISYIMESFYGKTKHSIMFSYIEFSDRRYFFETIQLFIPKQSKVYIF